MAKFDASFQFRVGLRGKPGEAIEVAEGESATIEQEGVPTVEELTSAVGAAIEVLWPTFTATVGGERLDR